MTPFLLCKITNLSSSSSPYFFSPLPCTTHSFFRCSSFFAPRVFTAISSAGKLLYVCFISFSWSNYFLLSGWRHLLWSVKPALRVLVLSITAGELSKCVIGDGFSILWDINFLRVSFLFIVDTSNPNAVPDTAKIF